MQEGSRQAYTPENLGACQPQHLSACQPEHLGACKPEHLSACKAKTLAPTANTVFDLQPKAPPLPRGARARTPAPVPAASHHSVLLCHHLCTI
eukprot:359190-Chlamydomonas_euryale.AAC.5